VGINGKAIGTDGGTHNVVGFDQAPTASIGRRKIRTNGAAAKPAVWTEDDLTIRLAETYPDLRYVDDWKRWMKYTIDGVWRKDNTRSIFDRAKGICRDASVGISPKHTATLKWLRSAKTRAAVENMAREMPGYAAVPEQWDADLMVMNTPSGTCRLEDGSLHDHRMEDYLTKTTTVAPRAGAHALWDTFLDRVTASDAEMQQYLQRMAGYCLSGDISEHVLFFLYGTGANGKTTFTNTLLGIWGDYGQTAAMETFTENKNDRHPTELAALRGARLVVASEVEVGKHWAETRLTDLTGGGKIRAHFMHCDDVEYVPAFKLMLQGNHKPSLRSVNEAVRRRLHLVPFTVTIPPEQRDPELTEKLRTEWPAILQWAIDGCLAWQREGLNPPAAVRDATEEYLAAEDVFQTWLDDRCILSPQAGSTKSSLLYEDFRKWAERSGERCGTQRWFSQGLMERGFKIRRSMGKRVDGITLARADEKGM
jgi:putative DNA primase/helicase